MVTRRGTSTKIRYSNVGADGPAGTLTVVVDSAADVFADDFESRTTNAWSATVF